MNVLTGSSSVAEDRFQRSQDQNNAELHAAEVKGQFVTAYKGTGARRGAPVAPVRFMHVMRWDVHGGGSSALLAGCLQWKGSQLHFVGCLSSFFSKFVLGSRGRCWDKTWTEEPSWRVRARSINYTVLTSGHWRTTQAGDLFIAEIPSLCSGQKAIIC